MTAWTRWLKFNAVGAMGMVVQLGALAVLNRVLRGQYLWATAIALEITLLHNFAWHVRYTWRDRRAEGSRPRWLARFHLSNGAVSLAGNLGLMRLLVHGAHVPVVVANALAILCCSLLNFALGNEWVFAPGETPAKATHALCRVDLQAPKASAERSS